MTTPDPPVRRRRALRLTLIILGVLVLTALVASLQLSGR